MEKMEKKDPNAGPSEEQARRAVKVFEALIDKTQAWNYNREFYGNIRTYVHTMICHRREGEHCLST